MPPIHQQEKEIRHGLEFLRADPSMHNEAKMFERELLAIIKSSAPSDIKQSQLSKLHEMITNVGFSTYSMPGESSFRFDAGARKFMRLSIMVAGFCFASAAVFAIRGLLDVSRGHVWFGIIELIIAIFLVDIIERAILQK